MTADRSWTHSDRQSVVAERDKLKSTVAELTDAIHSLFNVEGAARIGAESGAFKGLDWKWHFDKARAALAKAKE